MCNQKILLFLKIIASKCRRPFFGREVVWGILESADGCRQEQGSKIVKIGRRLKWMVPFVNLLVICIQASKISSSTYYEFRLLILYYKFQNK